MARFVPIVLVLAYSLLVNAISVGTPISKEVSHISHKRAVCTPISAANAGIDDVPAIEAAIASCGTGGTIVIPVGLTYVIRSTLSFAGCVGCDFQSEGTLKCSDDLDYWEGKQAMFLMSGITGAKVRSLTGTGVVDGNGQSAYNYFATNTSYARPTMWYITGSSEITISNLRFKNPPNVFHSAAGSSTNIIYDSLTLTAASKSTVLSKNTDGWNIGPASYVTITNAVVENQDDCIALKRGANYVTVTGISCSGSHAVGIKVYPGGFGTAVVSNVTWDTVNVINCPYAAQIQNCYSQTAAYCAANPGTATITDVKFANFKGTTSTSYEPTVANIDCPLGTCDVVFSEWSVKPPTGTASFLCANIDGTPGVTCTTGATG